MRKAKWISIEDIEDNKKIWVGTKVRLFNVGLNVDNKKDDFYDYLVSKIYGNDEYFQLVNLSQGEAGNIICLLKKELPNQYAIVKTLKKMMDMKNTFLLIE